MLPGIRCVAVLRQNEMLEYQDTLRFFLPRRWLSSLTPVTYFCMLLGIRCVAVLRQNEMLEYQVCSVGTARHRNNLKLTGR